MLGIARNTQAFITANEPQKLKSLIAKTPELVSDTTIITLTKLMRFAGNPVNRQIIQAHIHLVEKSIQFGMDQAINDLTPVIASAGNLPKIVNELTSSQYENNPSVKRRLSEMGLELLSKEMNAEIWGYLHFQLASG